jgi:hypothetical protein
MKWNRLPVVMPRLSRVSTSFSQRPQQKASMAGQTPS